MPTAKGAITTNSPCAPGTMQIHLEGFSTKKPDFILKVDQAPGSNMHIDTPHQFDEGGSLDLAWPYAMMSGEYKIEVWQTQANKDFNHIFVAGTTATVA